MKQLAITIPLGILLAGSSWGCGSPFENCEAHRSCPTKPDSGGAGGTDGGDANTAGSNQAGGSLGDAGADGSSAGVSGGGTAGGGGNEGGSAGEADGAPGGTGADGATGGEGDPANGGAGGAQSNHCDPDPCIHGVCVAVNSSATCKCSDGFAGDRCDLLRFEPLPISVGATFYHSAEDLSGDGFTFVGWVGSSSTTIRPFRWTREAGIEDLTNRLTSAASLTGVNGNGTIFVGKRGSAIYRWTVSGTPLDLPLPSTNTSCGRDGAKISDDGTTIVALCGSGQPSEPYRGVRWKQSGNQFVAEPLPLPTGSTASGAAAVSRDGSVVVGSVSGSTADVAYRWTNSDMGSLGLLPGGRSSQAVGVSGDGLVVVGSGDGPTVGFLAWRWTPREGIVQLPLPISEAMTLALSASEDGSVILGVQFDATNATWNSGEALLWDVAGVHYLRDLLLATGVPSQDLAGWKLGLATSVSLDGKTIGGTGTNPSGFPETWIARLP